MSKRPLPLVHSLRAGPYTVRGVSLGGIYTSLQVPELGAVFDVGMPIRGFASTDHLFLSHGHGDHVGALAAMLGIRGLLHTKQPPNVYMPAPIADDVRASIDAMSRLQRHDLTFTAHPMAAGDEIQLRRDLHVQAFKTHHPVPSLGYRFFDRVKKLRPEFKDLPGREIGERKKAGEDLFTVEERSELAYATDTLIRVIDTSPELVKTRVLILECTFLDEKKTLEASRAGCHIHLDELLERADAFENEHLVLMHFSQLYMPRDVHRILRERWPADHPTKLHVFAPAAGPWP